MNATPYTPEPGSLAEKVCAYFVKNPDEALSAKDIMLKFDLVAAAASIGKLLEPAIGAKLLRICQANTYAAGIMLADIAMPKPAKLLRTTKHHAQNRLPAIDATTLRVRKGIPVPAVSRGAAASNKYGPVLDLLSEPGTSIELPQEYAGAIRKAANTYGKSTSRKFAIRTAGTSMIGIWRIA